MALLSAAVLGACGGAADAPTGSTTEPPINPAPVTPGLLGLTITGLPAGVNAAVTVVGPNAASFSRTATGSLGWTDVPPGRYTITAGAVRTPNGTFAATPATQSLTVTAASAATATIAYAPVPSVFALDITGLPGGVAAGVSLTPPRGSATAVAQSGVFTAPAQSGADATADRWSLTAQEITSGGTRYLPTPTTLDTTVLLGDTARAAVRYTVGSGAIAIVMGGLPTGVSADAELVAPDNSTRPISGTTTITGLDAGRYRLVSRRVTRGALTFAPDADTLVLDVARSLVATPATVTYVAQAGRLSLTVSGLPNGAAGDLTLTGPAGSRALSGSTTLDSLPVGSYTLTAAALTLGTERYVPTPASQTVTVGVGGTVTASVNYTVAPTLVDITVTGLPNGARAEITLTNPAGNTMPVSASLSVPATVLGRWRLTALDVVSGGSTYSPTPASYDQVVAAGDRLSLPVQYAVSSGGLALVVSGLPSGTGGSVTVTGPRNFGTVVTGTTTLTNLPPGTYTLTAASITASGVTWLPAPASQTVSVSKSVVATPATVTYAPAAGAIALTVNGLSGGSASITVTGPGGYSQQVTGSTTLTGLAPGTYTIAAAGTTIGGNAFVPSPASQSITVSGTPTPVSATVTYAQTTGSLALAVTGLPPGSNGAITITGPNAFSRALAGTTTLTGLTPGNYTVAASNVTIAGSPWTASPPTQVIAVTATPTAAPATVSYAQNPANLAITVSGLPNGTAAALTVTGPNSFSQVVTTSTTLTNLVPGNYTVAASTVTAAGNSYTPNTTSQAVSVTSGTTASASVTYTITTGSLALAITGLPGGANGNVTITGPNAFVRTLTATTTLTGLAPGTYTVAASNVTITGTVWTAAPASQNVVVAASVVAAPATVSYAQNPGALALTVSGLPSASASITVTGPNSYSQNVTSSTTLSNLTPGSYTISASTVVLSGNRYSPTAAVQTVTISGGATATGSVTYAIATGSLALTVSGLPGGTNAAITVTGPNAFSQPVTASTTLTTLTPGSYTVTAANVTAAGTTYAPALASQVITVSASVTAATASVSYAAQGGGGGGGGGVNYSISGVYLTQAIQKPDNSVALVANRDALLRVFVVANGANTARPDVRVRLYDGATLLQTSTITAPEASVRTATAEGTLSSTWNLLVPAANVRTTLRVLVDLDPTQAVADADRSDNTWPAGGAPQPITVSTAPTFTVRFVPVTVGTLTGNVSAANKDQFLATSRRIWPLQNVVSDVRAPFTSSATDLQSNDGNGNWLTVLSEMNTLRSTDGAPSTMHYYGVVKVNYSSGVAGYGYVPGRAAIGWDYLPSGDGVAAHEWGHNFSRQHAPCGTTGDPNYPYAGAIINYWGWNSTTNTLVSPNATDVMSYCSNNWVSDYNWTAVLNYRATSGLQAAALQAGSNTPQDGLLVWGRVVNGAIELEPAFRVTAPITPAAARPTHRLDLLDAAGAALLQLPIEASLVDHVENREERQFAVVVPYSAAVADRLEQIRVADQRAPLRSVARRAVFPSPAAARAAGVQMRASDLEPGESLTPDGPTKVRVAWTNTSYGMAMVRDASTGQIMGYVRRQGATVNTGGRRVEVVFSDGVRSLVKGRQ